MLNLSSNTMMDAKTVCSLIVLHSRVAITSPQLLPATVRTKESLAAGKIKKVTRKI